MDGILIINKEKGFTSFDVVAKLRGILHQKKIGHTGTLDPDATGVLPVCLGRATKVIELLTDTDKTYEAVLRLGVCTDTQDMSGRILSSAEVSCSEEEVKEAIRAFVGDILQVPPMYSALKVKGQKLVDLARAGKEVEREARPITIYSIDILNIDLPLVRMRVTASKGTYIRTLCHDIGRRLGCGGAMESLIRVKAGGYPLEMALTLSQVEDMVKEGKLEEFVRPLADVFADLPSFTVRDAGIKALANGNKLHLSMGRAEGDVRQDRVAVYMPDGSFTAVYTWNQAEKMLKPVKMFL